MRRPSYHSSEDAWFLERLKSLALPVDQRSAHPTRAILHAYLHNRLPDRWLSAEELQGDSRPWTLTMVSQHVLGCPSCQRELSQMRRAQLHSPWEAKVLHLGSPQAAMAHLRVFALLAVVLLLLNGALLMLFPTPGGKFIPCSTVVKGLYPKGESTDKSSLPLIDLDANKLCWSAPSEQPWQTWWAPLAIALWLPLLVLHLLWAWASALDLPRRREWA
ncbi:MAG: hypothetical protein NZ610_04280 [Candidatus Bipolaricaulota bacterium]|nr:hypothetical protein [Candidatus Bipolaricaulota bacterium]MCS7274608.1 hypothetical protein [Candidatus Bipolaricaulota bacterium]MDW8110961.1 hypothetical protein [Candidatus Bipolaricaulota bacterium]MDW8329038.1 hypothetical protein [Candidatus Bipolaricaulota bacterium]